MSKSIVALVGRPNVGKSTLFNRFIGERFAIVEDVPGTTRDRIYGETEWNGVTFTVVDTGGLLVGVDEPLIDRVRVQAEAAIREADVIIFLVDVKEGLTVADEDVVRLLREADKPVILAVNKADNQQRRLEALEFWALGLDEPMPISALHGTGTGDLLDEVVAAFSPEEESADEGTVRMAIVGRPNVGKSSLLNQVLGRERAIVHEMPGTTRDAIDTEMTFNGRPITLIDTAGIRRRGRIEAGIERYSVLRAMRAIQRADVALLLIDATEGVTAQDQHIAGYVLDEHKSVVVLINKWDLVPKDAYTMPAYTEHVRHELRFLSYVPVLYISAKTGRRVHQVLPTALDVYEARFRRISTGELNRLVQDTVARHAPPSKGGKRLKFFYATQAAVDPPTFVFFVNDPRLMHFSYQRFIENSIRQEYRFLGTPLRFSFRARQRE
ncbi:MAG: GTPase Der [Anaerolineales bacterium]|nr:GTPase Der [Anaerolineales bacterium]